MDPVFSLSFLRPRSEPRLTLRELAPSLVATFGLLAVASLLASAGSPAASGSSAAALLSVALYVGFRQIPFELGGVSATAKQVALVPLWFTVAPAALPLLVVGAELVARALLLVRRGRGGEAPGQGALTLSGSAAAVWPVVGPAAVFALVQPGVATLADMPVYVLALATQVALAAVVAVLTPLTFGGARVSALALPWRGRLRQLRPSVLLDAALTPVGVLVAIATLDSPAMVLTAAPLAVLLGQFAKERDERMVKATELSHAYRGTAQLMGDVLEADDAYTGGEHTEGVVELSLGVGRQLGLDDHAMRNLEFGALLHDIGKLRVPNEIINKPGKLNDEEWSIIKRHPAYGQEMLDRVGGALSEAAPIVRAHHERWDGDGYPDRLAGVAIPIEARIITACDSFSAMTTNRSYRRAMTHFEAVAELERCSGTQFDPAVVAALSAVVAIEMTPESGSPLAQVPQPADASDAGAGEASTPAGADPGDATPDDAGSAAQAA